MTLKQLEAFYMAATSESFAFAARRIHLSISSLSKRIGELEETLGQPLFDRSGHRAILTLAGSDLLPRALELLRAADQVRADFGNTSGLRGHCRFGIGELTALTWLPRLAASIREEHPGLRFEPSILIGEAMERMVQDGKLDFAIVAGRSSRSSIASWPIAETRFSWCIATALAKSEDTMKPEMLKMWPLVTLPSGAGTTQILEDWLTARGAYAEHRIPCNSWAAIAGMIAEGVGIGLLPASWADSLNRRGVLKILRGAPELSTLQYSYQWRRDDSRPLTTIMRELVARAADFSSGSRVLK